jgi:predicted nucleic acid-binding Zn ribbon protein
MYDLQCSECSAPFQAKRPDKRYCSFRCQSRAGRLRRLEQTDVTKAGRDCGMCGTHFDIIPPNSNQRYCSEKCAIEASRKHRREFMRRKPGIQKIYSSRRAFKDVALNRLNRRYPNMPKACEACGEARILEIAHRPEFKRNGAWRLAKNTQAHMVWIMCPTCHKLLDRGICTQEQLGLK